ncbi:DNA methylase [Mycoplasmopsis californica]|uniref:tRNA1(Val) (Adenine(37)-N6)-methyltransferase n=1 Tax=Mycoplasmopsis equigenitalium TaxID=114883 RepID=A0ABY5J0P3_9BACT|nr:tRNA1(Val) (adenine(37)-N6)-methyltransferase [Mycoplasmopsis equigenitalium]UUD36824.1 tRNA1(Val) (adenine(37)-N6)-methyltransferase [Mycoplasmopsis equigenitalium]VEU69879.1 DNA methylase [Mycoplasmopsis californica]
MKDKLVKNSLGYDSNLYVYQDKDMFNYSVDTILLGNFVFLNKRMNNLLEIGTNNGALAIFISERNKNLQIDALELQAKACEIAKLNIKLNNKQNMIKIINDDFNDFYKNLALNQGKKYDSIVCNPPFYPLEKSVIKTKNITQEKLIATHEIHLNLEQIIIGSAKIIEQKGYLTMVLPVERLVDVMELLRKHKFEPKRIRFVCPRIYEKPKFVLIEARYMSGWGIHFLPNLYLHPEDKSNHIYNKEIADLYKPIKVKE